LLILLDLLKGEPKPPREPLLANAHGLPAHTDAPTDVRINAIWPFARLHPSFHASSSSGNEPGCQLWDTLLGCDGLSDSFEFGSATTALPILFI
jgi:hypothetical protein